jgi:sugar phosphate isomerase/epimerase
MKTQKLAGFADEASLFLDKQIKAIKELGWKGIELRNVMHDDKKMHFDDLDDIVFHKMTDAIIESGIEIVSFGTQIANWSRNIASDFAIDKEELKRIIPRMQKTGTKIARIMSYPNAGFPDMVWKKEAFRRIKELSRMAEDGGIILCHENCSGYASICTENTIAMLNEIDSNSLKLIFDTGNFWEFNYSSLEFYKKIKEHVIHIHIKDYKKNLAAEKGWSAEFPGKGAGEVKAVLEELKRDNYTGWYSIEPHLVAVAHEGKDATTENSYDLFIEYGRQFEKLL